jgi:hypothetical protein
MRVLVERRGTGAKTADRIALDVLAHEFDADDRAEAERQIKRRLRYHGQGPYRSERVDLVRSLKDRIQVEINRGQQSRYYVGSHGRYAVMQDFDVPRLIRDLTNAFVQVPEAEIRAFVPFAISLYYLR